MAASLPDLQDLFERQKAYHPVVKKTTAEERIEKLKNLREAVLKHQEELQNAVYNDLRKSPAETGTTEVFTSVSEINHTIKNLKKWMKPVRVKNNATFFGHRSEIIYEPRGTVLIISPWNYPFSLTINPLVAAVAAGNCAVIKPSEATPSTSAFIKKFISQVFDEREVAVVEGDAQITQELLKLPFDHIFFTGSTRVGKVVMEAAAKNLASVTLELGGKSPTIIDETADLKKAARRIVWAKFMNDGQTCVAPDYILTPENKVPELVQELNRTIGKMYGKSEEERAKNPDLCRVVNQGHYERLKKLLASSVEKGAKAEIGGTYKDEDRYIDPTVLTQVSLDSPDMAEEIFGPILPIVSYRVPHDVYPIIQGMGKPLALYVFSEDQAAIDEAIRNTTAGGTAVNNCIVHISHPNLPFGGVGGSGQGSYHGHAGFKVFSHERSVFRQGPLDIFKLFYPPYTGFTRRLIRFAIKYMA